MRFMNAMANGGSAYSRNAPLTDDQLRAAVPSVFAEHAHESRSERFAYIPTVRVLDGLRKEGFQPFFAQQGRSRVPGKADFTKHLIRLRHASRATEKGEAHEIVLLNAHDGTAAYRMFSGVIRFLCMNGLMTGEAFDDVKVRHTGDAVGQVIDGAYRVLETSDRVMGKIGDWKSIRVRGEQAEAFAAAVHTLRFGDPGSAPVEPMRLLTARRPEDDGDSSLWGTFNRAQENVIRGGQRGLVRQQNGRVRRATTRQVNGIDQTTALNRALWTLTERMEALVRSQAA